ncbi:MAG: hypothetical protein ISP86_01235 [Shewanellaceae bacterium]|nr:hypothetical protein [Shewanellaceae bacterium]
MYLSKIKPLSIMVMCSLLILTACGRQSQSDSDHATSQVNNAPEVFEEISIDLSNIQYVNIDVTTDETDKVKQAQAMLNKSHELAQSEDTAIQNQAFNSFKQAVQGFIEEAEKGNAYAYNALAQVYSQDYQAFPDAFKAFHQMEQALKFAQVVGYFASIDDVSAKPNIVFQSAQLLRIRHVYQNLKATIEDHKNSDTVDPSTKHQVFVKLFEDSKVFRMLSDINDSSFDKVIASDVTEKQYELLKTDVTSFRKTIEG